VRSPLIPRAACTIMVCPKLLFNLLRRVPMLPNAPLPPKRSPKHPFFHVVLAHLKLPFIINTLRSQTLSHSFLLDCALPFSISTSSTPLVSSNLQPETRTQDGLLIAPGNNISKHKKQRLVANVCAQEIASITRLLAGLEIAFSTS
jgi:hypothetical protein